MSDDPHLVSHPQLQGVERHQVKTMTQDVSRLYLVAVSCFKSYPCGINCDDCDIRSLFQADMTGAALPIDCGKARTCFMFLAV